MKLDSTGNLNFSIDRSHNTSTDPLISKEKFKNVSCFSVSTTTFKFTFSKSKKLRDQFLKIEKTLYQTQNQSNQDPLNFPIKLTNKLGHLNSLVTYDDFPPTNQDEEVRAELTDKVKEQLKAFNNLIEQDLKEFNNEFAELKLDYLKID